MPPPLITIKPLASETRGGVIAHGAADGSPHVKRPQWQRQKRGAQQQRVRAPPQQRTSQRQTTRRRNKPLKMPSPARTRARAERAQPQNARFSFSDASSNRAADRRRRDDPGPDRAAARTIIALLFSLSHNTHVFLLSSRLAEDEVSHSLLPVRCPISCYMLTVLRKIVFCRGLIYALDIVHML